jgi:hypothetical protein
MDKGDADEVGRRALLGGFVFGGMVAGVPWTGASAAAAAAEKDAPPAGSPATMTAADMQRIASVLYATTLTDKDAEKIAKVAVGALANLHYLTLLKSEDVQLPYGYAVTVDEASRP